MILNKKQEEGLMIALKQFNEGEKLVVISGYAGTGKSTLVKFIIEALGCAGIDPSHDVCFATYTGKAAQVLLKKGNKNVLTLHKLLYDSIPKPNGSFIRIPKATIEYSIVVVDEVSMVPKFLMDLLLSHNVFVIALGDPFQLPPVDKDQDNELLAHPHVFLDEIMRQALDSEIIRLSMQIRKFEPIEYRKGGDAIVIPKKELNTGALKWADQIIVATNKTRIAINNQMRSLLGRGDKPENGDKVICLRNYWNNYADNADPLVNGTIGYIQDIYESYNYVPYHMGGQRIDVLNGTFISDSDANFGELQMDKKQILTGERCLDFKTIYRISSNWKTKNLIPMEFTYGYAITGHKSQGSEWDNVLVLEENFPFDREEQARWLYTCVTRASSHLVLVR